MLNNSSRKAPFVSVSPVSRPLARTSSSVTFCRKEETVRFLEDAYREPDSLLIYLQCEPIFGFVHNDPHYRVLAEPAVPTRTETTCSSLSTR